MISENEAPYLSLQAEHFLSHMFGKQGTHGLAGAHGRVWVKYCERALNHLERYVQRNIVTTQHHKREIR